MEQEVRSRKALEWDLSKSPVRELNNYLHHGLAQDGVEEVRVLNPDGAHHIAVGLDTPVKVEVMGNAGYYVGGMNKQAEITVHGSAGWSVAENIMSGVVRIEGYVSECAGASGHGGVTGASTAWSRAASSERRSSSAATIWTRVPSPPRTARPRA